MITFVGGLLLGTGLGANDAGNVFGTAVGSRMVPFRTAAVLGAVCVLLGAVLQGHHGIATLEGLTTQSSRTAAVVLYGAGLTVALMTLLKLPTSTSQAVVGAIIGVGAVQNQVNIGGLGKVVLCWVTTPVGAVLFYLLFDRLCRWTVRRFQLSVMSLDWMLRMGLVVVGSYGAYALGANNVANVAAVFVGAGLLSPLPAACLGGLSIALGVLLLSRPVMMTVGTGIVKMDAFSAFVAVLSQAVTVHIYAMIGVPVSSSQAIVGAVLGIGLVKGMQVIRYRVLRNIVIGWLCTPVFAGLAAAGLLLLSRLRYVP